jgi:hypothetical protein
MPVGQHCPKALVNHPTPHELCVLFRFFMTSACFPHGFGGAFFCIVSTVVVVVFIKATQLSEA